MECHFALHYSSVLKKAFIADQREKDDGITQQIRAVQACFGGVFLKYSFSVVRFCLRNGLTEAVGAERMCLSQDKGRSGMIMLVRES